MASISIGSVDSNDSILIEKGDLDYVGAVTAFTINQSQISNYTQLNEDRRSFFTADYNGFMFSADTESDSVVFRIGVGTFSIQKNGGATKAITTVSASDDYADDEAAATGGIAVGELYHTAGTVKIRLA